MAKKKCVIVTTIFPKNKVLEKFSKIPDYDLIIVGDKKSPASYDLDAVYLDIAKQQELFPKFAGLLPYNHYARKNLGYLYAIVNGYEVIAESDDDNLAYDNWGRLPDEIFFTTITAPKFPNVYSEFTAKKVWPRGFPLDLILANEKIEKIKTSAKVLVWQGLVDGSPDVDAVYRLVINEPVEFEKNKTVALAKGVISPFNTQNTFWQKQAFAFLYLPHTVTFRYTDILKSLVAQFGIWKLGGLLGFMSPTVFQERNAHNLLKDFADETPMYETFYKAVEILESSKLTGQPRDLLVMYEALAEQGIVHISELGSVSEWLNNLPA